MEILMNRRRLLGVPVLEAYAADAAAKAPLVFLMHGFTGCKEHMARHAQHLARQGYAAVSVDLHLHGELAEGEFVASRVGVRLEEVIERSAEALPELARAYAGHPVADAGRVALWGVSLGGAVAFRLLERRELAPAAVVAQIAGARPFWPATLRRVMQLYPEFGVTEAALAWAEQHVSTGDFLPGGTDVPLLMQYGQEDPIVPIEEVRRIYAQLATRYADLDRIQLLEYAGVGHDTPAAMMAPALAWLARWTQGAS